MDKIILVKNILRQFKTKAKKNLGQNFLVNDSVINEIVAAADISRNEKILEIGPGLGFLTDKLLTKSGQVVLIEKDRYFYQYLNQKYQDNNQIEIIEGDVLRLDLIKHGFSNFNFKIVANLPFYISGKFLRIILDGKIKPSKMVLVLQKELAQRIIADPGKHSLLSLSVQYYADAQLKGIIERKNFFPRPQVDSAIIDITPYQKKYNDEFTKSFFRVLRIAFSSRRKQLHNNLAAGLKCTHDEIKYILVDSGLKINIRAQQLSLKQWFDLYEKIKFKQLL